MAVNSVGSTSSNVTVVDKDKQGFSGLDSTAFMNLLITQLQNQDPLDPMDNDELLSQISTMRNLQANIELGDAMKAITTNQQLSTAAAFIGKKVVGTADDSTSVSGVADRAFLKNGLAYVGVGSSEVALTKVTSIQQAGS